MTALRSQAAIPSSETNHTKDSAPTDPTQPSCSPKTSLPGPSDAPPVNEPSISNPKISSAKCRYNAVDQRSLWIVLSVQGKLQPFLIDTGATISIVTSSSIDNPKPCNLNITTADGRPIQVLGKCPLQLKFGNRDVTHDFAIVPKGTSNILGMDVLLPLKCVIDVANKKLRVGKFNMPLHDDAGLRKFMSEKVRTLETHKVQPEPTASEQLASVPRQYKASAEKLLNIYEDLFRENPIGCGKRFPHVIELTDQRPIKQSSRKVSAQKSALQQQEVKKMLEAGVIRSYKSP